MKSRLAVPRLARCPARNRWPRLILNLHSLRDGRRLLVRVLLLHYLRRQRVMLLQLQLLDRANAALSTVRIRLEVFPVKQFECQGRGKWLQWITFFPVASN